MVKLVLDSRMKMFYKWDQIENTLLGILVNENCLNYILTSPLSKERGKGRVLTHLQMSQ